MARWWKEPLDPAKHNDYMRTSHIGGIPLEQPSDRLVVRWVYFVRVCSFTFQFHSLQQLHDCLAYFEQSIHPSSRLPQPMLEHYWQRWYERLPAGITKATKRKRIVKALHQALHAFQHETCG